MAQIKDQNQADNQEVEHSAALLIEGIVKNLVHEPDQVRVETVTEGDGSLVTLLVSNSDFANVIGPNGRTARSLRTVLTAFGKRHHERLMLDIRQKD
jgi:uncharacterized protein